MESKSMLSKEQIQEERKEMVSDFEFGASSFSWVELVAGGLIGAAAGVFLSMFKQSIHYDQSGVKSLDPETPFMAHYNTVLTGLFFKFQRNYRKMVEDEHIKTYNSFVRKSIRRAEKMHLYIACVLQKRVEMGSKLYSKTIDLMKESLMYLKQCIDRMPEHQKEKAYTDLENIRGHLSTLCKNAEAMRQSF